MTALEERLVWMFGAARAGGSHLLALLRHPELVRINDVGLAPHLVPPGWVPEGVEYFRGNRNADDHNYFFAEQYLPDLGPELGEFVLGQLERQAREIGGPRAENARWILVNEPGGQAADSIFRLLPRSRMLLLLRDGREVIAQAAQSAGELPPAQRRAYLQRQAVQWVFQVDALQRVLEAAPERQRLLVRYEDLVDDPTTNVRWILDWLGLSVDGVAASPATSPDERGALGPGSPLDREDWGIVMGIMGDKLKEVGYGG